MCVQIRDDILLLYVHRRNILLTHCFLYTSRDRILYVVAEWLNRNYDLPCHTLICEIAIHRSSCLLFYYIDVGWLFNFRILKIFKIRVSFPIHSCSVAWYEFPLLKTVHIPLLEFYGNYTDMESLHIYWAN